MGTDKEYLSANNEEMLLVLSLNKKNGLNQPKELSCLDEAVDKGSAVGVEFLADGPLHL